MPSNGRSPAEPPGDPYAAARARIQFYREFVIPLFRDVFFVLLGTAITGYQLVTQSSVLWPYVIVLGCFGFPGWIRVVAPLLGLAAPPPPPSPPGAKDGGSDAQ